MGNDDDGHLVLHRQLAHQVHDFPAGVPVQRRGGFVHEDEVGVGDESDGYAEAWYLPAAGDVPAGYATEGTWYDYFEAKAGAGFGAEWGPGYATFQYPNDNRASTIWYHDHTLGMTRVNVYAGPAGFYLLRGKGSGVIDSRTGLEGVLPGPAPGANDKFPPNKTYYEIPIAIQDRSFNADGSLYYPDNRAFFEGLDSRKIRLAREAAGRGELSAAALGAGAGTADSKVTG